jgi:hypothetical protein
MAGPRGNAHPPPPWDALLGPGGWCAESGRGKARLASRPAFPRAAVGFGAVLAKVGVMSVGMATSSWAAGKPASPRVARTTRYPSRDSRACPSSEFGRRGGILRGRIRWQARERLNSALAEPPGIAFGASLMSAQASVAAPGA